MLISLYVGFFFFILWLEILYYHVENEMKLTNPKILVEIKENQLACGIYLVNICMFEQFG